MTFTHAQTSMHIHPHMVDSFNPGLRKARDFTRPGPPWRERLLALAGFTIAPNWPWVVDISHWNTVNDLAAAKAAGVDVLIFKATESTWFTDPLFTRLWPQALDLGFILGVYHFFRSDVGGVAQADYHLEATRPLFEAAHGHILPSFYDVETADGVGVEIRRQRLYNCLDVHRRGRTTPGVYSSPYLWGSLVGNVDWMVGFFGWDAHWTSALEPTIPVGWQPENVLLWQRGVYPKHSWVKPVPGIGGEVDEGYYLGSCDSLRQRIGLDPVVTLEQRVASLEQRVTALEGKAP